jgi:hypothetical protein
MYYKQHGTTMEARLPIKNHHMRNYKELEKVAATRFGVIIKAVVTKDHLCVTVDNKLSISKWATIEDFVGDVIMFHKYGL